MAYKSFEELDCWKASRDVKGFVREITAKLPSEEKYDLSDNMRRAARSATRNIAEGFGRFGYQDKIRFCLISRGSLFEVIDDLITCKEEEYISSVQYVKGRELCDKAIALINGYINYLESAKANFEATTKTHSDKSNNV